MEILSIALILLPFLILVFYSFSNRSKLNLNGKTILLTGGCQGIGLELLHLFMKQYTGITLIIIDLFIDNKVDLINQYSGSQNQLLIEQIDVSDFPKVEQFIKRHKIDVLVNNAGIFRKGNVREKEFRVINQTLQVNFIAPIHLIKLCLPGMIRQNWGVITNVCSLTKDIGGLSMADYCSSKSGLYQFHSVLRAELKSEKQNISTNVINPYVLDGGMFNNFHIPILSYIFKALKHRDVARIIHHAIVHQQEEVYIPSYMVLLAFIYFLVPNRLIDQLQIIFLKDACKYVEKKTD